MSFQGKNLSSWNTWLGLWSPGLKNDYNVELRSFDPDEDVEKILTPSNSTLQYQVFVLSISIPDKHAVEEIEVGRVPQIIFLLARVGGWMSVLSAILGLCWVQKHPYDPMVVTYEERTLLGTSEPRTQSQKWCLSWRGCTVHGLNMSKPYESLFGGAAKNLPFHNGISWVVRAQPVPKCGKLI